MDEHTSYEQAYRNGYEAGKRDVRKKGKWIHRPDERICPFCGCHYSYFGGKDHNYCHDCGIDMRGEKDG